MTIYRLRRRWNTPLDDLDEDNHWAWIRGPFLSRRPDSNGHQGYFVVHGHSIVGRTDKTTQSDQIARCRLNCDVGSYDTKRLKMAIFNDEGLVATHIVDGSAPAKDVNPSP